MTAPMRATDIRITTGEGITRVMVRGEATFDISGACG